MLQAHSILWHYLWVAPNLILLFLSFLMWKRGLREHFPAFFAFALLSSIGHLGVYTADVDPAVSAENFWRTDWANLVVEGLLKFVLVGEIFARAFGAYAAVARLSRLLIRGIGVALVVAAALAAAYTPKDGLFGIVSGAHILERTIYLIEAGLLLSIFLFSRYFNLQLDRRTFGIALGLSISACVHLATWAIMANGTVPNSVRYDLDFINMGTYHLCVLLWFYYLLVPGRVPEGRKSSLLKLGSDEGLDALNQEMERLLHR